MGASPTSGPMCGFPGGFPSPSRRASVGGAGSAQAAVCGARAPGGVRGWRGGHGREPGRSGLALPPQSDLVPPDGGGRRAASESLGSPRALGLPRSLPPRGVLVGSGPAPLRDAGTQTRTLRSESRRSVTETWTKTWATAWFPPAGPGWRGAKASGQPTATGGQPKAGLPRKPDVGRLFGRLHSDPDGKQLLTSSRRAI